MQQMLEVENDANWLVSKIRSCKRAEDLMLCDELMLDFVHQWGRTAQVEGWLMTFQLELLRQQALIAP